MDKKRSEVIMSLFKNPWGSSEKTISGVAFLEWRLKKILTNLKFMKMSL
jgi:hypothetical protein